MKRAGSLLLAAAVLIVSAGCREEPENSLPGAVLYQDGVYEVQMPEYDQGWKEYGRITVENGSIAGVEYDGISADGILKSEDEGYKRAMAENNRENGLPEVYPEKVFSSLLESFGQSGYRAGEVEMVAGATASSRHFVRVMEQLMENVEAGKTGISTLPLYIDGTYEVEMPEYEDGWKEYIIVALSDGRVAAVEYDAKNETGGLRSEDEAYKNSMISAGSGTWPEDYGQKLVDSFLAAGSPDEIEMVAGATASSQNFKKLMRTALEHAREGETGLWVAPWYEDGVYRAEMAKADQGWKEFVEITIQGGRIARVAFDAQDADGNYKSADQAYKQAMADGGSETWPEKFYFEILEEYQAKNYVAKDMETVAGATVSSGTFRVLAPAALQQARRGDPSVATVEIE